jgi:hypothetical protein
MILPTSVRCAAAVAIMALGAATDVPAQTAQTDAWKRVPAVPTTCYPDDDFVDRLNAASTAIQADIDRQREVNAQATQRFAAMDMMEKAQRMQAFMMKNPQAAMKMMQAEQAAGAAVATSVPEASENAKRLESELQRQQASFVAAAEAAVKPVRAKQQQLIDTKTVAVGEAQISMFTAAADHAQYVQLIAQENAEYEKACAPYFGAGGTFPKWLTSYRTEVIEKLIENGDAGESAMIMQMAAMDLPDGGYRSTYEAEQAINYLNWQRRVYSTRLAKARPVVELRK